MRAAVYLRVSEDRTGDEDAVTRQGEDAEALIQSRGWSQVGVYQDNDVSAKGRVKRPEFLRLVADISAGRIDVVIAWDWTRLTRNPRDRLTFIEAAKERGVIVSLVRGSDIDMSTPSGRFNAGILAEVAQHEIDQKADRQRSANEQRARKGEPPAGPVPFGFRPDRITHHPKQSAAIRDAYRDLLAGSTLAQIARDWNAAGLTSGRPRTGAMKAGRPSQWRSETVRAVLLKARNAGLREYRGETYPATWEPIVPVETFAAAKHLLADPGRRGAPPAARHLLSGVACCGRCGAPVNAGTGRGTYAAYRCRDSKGHVARRGDDVDGFITDLCIERLARDDAIGLIADEVPHVDVPGLRAKAIALRQRLESMAIEFADDPDISPAQLRVMTRRVKVQLAKVDGQLADAGRVSVLAPLIGADDVRAAWDNMVVDQRRAAIDSLMFVVLHPVGRGARRFSVDSVWTRWKHERSR